MNSQSNYINNFKKIIKEYFISISLYEEDISIIIYNKSSLNNIRYEINLDLNDFKNVSFHFNTMDLNGIYNILKNLISQDLFKIEKQFNDLVVSFLMRNIGIQDNDYNAKIQLILFGERDNNEYLYYLSEEILKSKNKINDLNTKINNLIKENENLKKNHDQFIQNNQNINNNNNSQISNTPKANTTPNNNINNEETGCDDFFSKLNVDINDNIQELLMDRKLIDDKVFDFLNKYELNKLVKLTLSHNKIITMKGIENCKFPNLISIHLNNNSINDLTFISKANFPMLERLWLNSNDINNISPLINSNFQKLNILSLSKNHISDISPLKDFNYPKLEMLVLDNNNISDISVLQLTKFKIQILALNNNKIINVSSFEFGNFTELRKLFLYSNSIMDISSFGKANLQKLELLSLNKNKIKNISFLENPFLKGLKELYLSDNQINDLSVFNRINIGFTKLYIDGNSFDVNNNSGIIQSLQSKIGEFHYKKIIK